MPTKENSKQTELKPGSRAFRCFTRSIVANGVETKLHYEKDHAASVGLVNHGRRWTQEEKDNFVKYRAAGYSDQQISALLGRTIVSIESYATKLNGATKSEKARAKWQSRHGAGIALKPQVEKKLDKQALSIVKQIANAQALALKANKNSKNSKSSKNSKK